jgi:hypothetical protein
MRKLFLGLVCAGSTAWAAGQVTFQDTFHRYVSGHDLFRLMSQKFPQGKPSEECAGLTTKNRAALGDSNPANGEMAYRTTSASFVRWYTRCLTERISSDYEATLQTAGGVGFYLGPTVTALLKGRPYEKAVTAPKDTNWDLIPVDLQTQTAEYLVRHYIGPGIHKDEAGLVKRLVTAVSGKGFNTFDALKRLALFIGMEESFLTY